jgi:hypothetical protein
MNNKIIKFAAIVICLFVLQACNNNSIQPEIEPVEEKLINTRGIDEDVPYLSGDQYFLEDNKVIWKLPSNIIPYRENIVEEADQKTFEVFFTGKESDDDKYETKYAKDEKHGYYEGEVIVGSHGSSFEILSYNYSKDRKFAYFIGKKIKESDGESFMVLDYIYAKDKNSAYKRGEKIEGSDGDTFEMIKIERFHLDHSYSKDKNFVYFDGERLEGADSNTFEVFRYNYSKDESNVYYLNNLIEDVDPSTFEVINHVYAKDNKYIYNLGEKIKDSDASSFKLNENHLEPYSAEDDTYWYYSGITISKSLKKKELLIEWHKAELFEPFSFLSENLDKYEGWIDVNCKTVGKAINDDYNNWQLVVCNRISSGLGYTYATPIRFLLIPNSEDFKVLSLYEHDVWIEEPELKDNLLADFFISDLIYPDEIIVDGENGSVIFNQPTQSMFMGYSEPYNHEADKEVFIDQPEWGVLYQDNTMIGKGGLLYELKDGTYITYKADYSSHLDLDDRDRSTIKPDELIWSNGEKNMSNYYLNHIYHCEAGINIVFVHDDVVDKSQLIKIGETKKGDSLFGFTNTNNAFFRYVIDNYHYNLKELGKMEMFDVHSDDISEEDAVKKKQQKFIDELGVVFWEDPFGRWIKMTKGEYFVGC